MSNAYLFSFMEKVFKTRADTERQDQKHRAVVIFPLPFTLPVDQLLLGA